MHLIENEILYHVHFFRVSDDKFRTNYDRLKILFKDQR